jgi:hypothetical protein
MSSLCFVPYTVATSLSYKVVRLEYRAPLLTSLITDTLHSTGTTFAVQLK